MPVNRREFLKLGGVLALPKSGLASAVGGNAGHGAAVLYDATKCIGCHACSNACRAWNQTADEIDASGLYDAPWRLAADTWTLIQLYQGEDEYSFVKRQCMHCEHPACASVCPAAALQKSDTGPVIYDDTKCIGCRYCMTACPFGVPTFEWDEAVPYIRKCTFCNDRLAIGRGPNCAEWCPTGALIWGRRGELLEVARTRIYQNPNRYVHHVYGEHEAGGTGWLYLSAVPFEKLGFPTNLGTTRYPEFTLPFLSAVPIVLVLWPALLMGIYAFTQRRERIAQAEPKKTEREIHHE